VSLQKGGEFEVVSCLPWNWTLEAGVAAVDRVRVGMQQIAGLLPQMVLVEMRSAGVCWMMGWT